MALTAKRPSKGEEIKKKLMDEVKDAQEKKKRLNADIEEDLYKRIKTQAVQEGRSVADITRELWIEYLSRNKLV
jgi:hypothetical protein